MAEEHQDTYETVFSGIASACELFDEIYIAISSDNVGTNITKDFEKLSEILISLKFFDTGSSGDVINSIERTWLDNNDKDGLIAFKKETERNYKLLTEVTSSKMVEVSNKVVEILSKDYTGPYDKLDKENLHNYASQKLSSGLIQRFNNLYDVIVWLADRADEYIEYIPTPELLDEIKRENLDTTLGVIGENIGYKPVDGGEYADSIAKLKDHSLVKIDDKGTVFLTNKGHHIYKTCFKDVDPAPILAG